MSGTLGTGLVDTSDGRPPSGQATGPDSAVWSPPGAPEQPAALQAPDEVVDVPQPWATPHESVDTPAAALVRAAAPEATADTRLRVVRVVDRGGEPRVIVDEVVGPDDAVRAVRRAQTGDDLVAVSIDSKVSIDTPAAEAMSADVLRARQWALDRLAAEQVWAGWSSGAGSVVAVVDTGVDGSHPDLAGQLTASGADFVTGAVGVSGGGQVDPNGHGTHVAGVIAAVRGNSVGVAGLAPAAKIMPLRVLDADGSGWSSHIAKAIIYATDRGADVVNLSLGGPTEDPTTTVAANYAMTKGVPVIAAAGNERATGNAPSFPAAVPGVIAVASTDVDDSSSAFSNTGTYVDVAAPGGRIISTVPAGYAYMSGTSMATPHVAAIAALAVDVTDGAMTSEQLASALTITARDLGSAGWDPEHGYGLPDPDRALCSLTGCDARAVSPVPLPPAPVSDSPSPLPTATGTATTEPEPEPEPVPSPSATSTPKPTPVPESAPSPTPSSPPASPTPTSSPAPTAVQPALAFTDRGGATTQGRRVRIRLRATDSDTGGPVAGLRVLVRGWRQGSVVVRRWVTTDRSGYAVTRIRVRATTRFDLKSPRTATTRSAASVSSIRWRVR